MRLDASDAQALTPEHAEAVTDHRGKPTAPDRMRPLERLAALCDAGTLRRIGARPAPATSASWRRRPGRPHPVVCYAQDSRHRRRIGGHRRGRARRARAAAGAARERMPVVGVPRVRRRTAAGGRGGARRLRPHLLRERRALAARVPQISVITGTSAGGGCYSPALTDFVVMTAAAGDVPHRAEGRPGGRRRGDQRRGPRRPRRPRAQRRLPLRRPTTTDEAVGRRATLLGYLPRRRRRRRRAPAAADAGAAADPGRHVPPTAARRSTTCATWCATSSTAADFLEVAPRWARNMVVGVRAHRRPAPSASSPTSRATSAA